MDMLIGWYRQEEYPTALIPHFITWYNFDDSPVKLKLKNCRNFPLLKTRRLLSDQQTEKNMNKVNKIQI